MKTAIKKICNKLGYNTGKLKKGINSLDPYCPICLSSTKIIDLESLAQISLQIPGMITPNSGQFLYSLCYMQVLQGDVVEIGSWQGRSTSFLARAVENSKNGKFYAIDHFNGNVGKEKCYVVNNKDLSDLKENFISNINKIGLSNSVNLLDMPNEEAEVIIRDIKIRFLFIDGDHTEEGVEKDIALFFPKLMAGSIVVFDDFSEGFPGVIKAVDNLINRQKFSRIMSYRKTLVLMV